MLSSSSSSSSMSMNVSNLGGGPLGTHQISLPLSHPHAHVHQHGLPHAMHPHNLSHPMPHPVAVQDDLEYDSSCERHTPAYIEKAFNKPSRISGDFGHMRREKSVTRRLCAVCRCSTKVCCPICRVNLCSRETNCGFIWHSANSIQEFEAKLQLELSEAHRRKEYCDALKLRRPPGHDKTGIGQTGIKQACDSCYKSRRKCVGRVGVPCERCQKSMIECTTTRQPARAAKRSLPEPSSPGATLADKPQCSTEGCQNLAQSRGRCRRCYDRDRPKRNAKRLNSGITPIHSNTLTPTSTLPAGLNPLSQSTLNPSLSSVTLTNVSNLTH